MTLPFGVWDVGQSFNHAVQLEEEEDDQYEGEDQSKRIRYNVKSDHGEMLKSELLIVAVGNAATSFIETYLDIPIEHIAEVVIPDKPRKKSDKQTCFLYKLNNCLICQCKSHVKAEDSKHWVSEFMSPVQAQKVLILSSLPKSLFQADQHLQESDEDILRYIKSSSLNIKTSVQLMEEGNIVKALPAALLSHCEVFNIPAVLYVNFTESHFVDVFTLKTYQPILEDGLLTNTNIKSSDTTIRHRLKIFDGIGVANNNLYI